MNQPEDPTTSNRPAPLDDPPETQREPAAAAGGPPAEPLEPAGPMESLGDRTTPPPPQPTTPAVERPAEPEARWEDVVDPAPTVEPDPPAETWPEPAWVRTAPSGVSPTSQGSKVDDEALDEGYDDYDDGSASRWVSLLATLGTALIGIVTVQVLTSVVEGLTLKSAQRVGVPDDLFHRLGYPFGGLGATALVFLVLGVVLVSMPSVLDELLSESQDRVVGVALIVAIIMGVVIAIGSLLAVRANLHEYAAKNVPVPSYVRVQFTNFLLGSLGAAALALFGSIASMNERSRESL